MSKNKKLVIVGIGETARLAYEYFTYDTKYDVVAFAVNQQYINSTHYLSLPVVSLESLEELYDTNNMECFIAAGSGHLNRDRANLYRDIKSKGYKCASYVSSKAFVWHDVEIGENCFILENNILQSKVKVGNNTTLWSGNHIGHLSQIKDNVFITSHCVISGNVTVGDSTFIGVNTCIADGVNIERDNFIGMGSVINKNTEANGFYIGNPAIKKNITAKKFCKVKD